MELILILRLVIVHTDSLLSLHVSSIRVPGSGHRDVSSYCGARNSSVSSPFLNAFGASIASLGTVRTCS